MPRKPRENKQVQEIVRVLKMKIEKFLEHRLVGESIALALQIKNIITHPAASEKHQHTLVGDQKGERPKSCWCYL